MARKSKRESDDRRFDDREYRRDPYYRDDYRCQSRGNYRSEENRGYQQEEYRRDYGRQYDRRYEQGYRQDGYGRDGGYRQGYPGGGYDDRYYEQNDRRKRAAKKKKRKRITFIIEILILVLLAAGLFVAAKVGKIKRADVSKGDIVINDNVNLKGYTNIALFGVDSREGSLDKEAHSDTSVRKHQQQDKRCQTGVCLTAILTWTIQTESTARRPNVIISADLPVRSAC